jgi:acetylornithine deacetylase/succinyl-diaminopimelate desuccinylase-like protein
VGEEGLGDLRGVKALVAETLKGRIDYFVALDGSGSSITNVGVGSRRYRAAFRGPGGHSYNNFGRASPVNALGRAIARISDIQVPAAPRTTFNVGRIGGGTAVNAIPEEAWMEVDLRSTDQAALEQLDRSVQQTLRQAAAAENARWKQDGAVTVTIERVGDRPGGRTDERSPIVQAALDASKTVKLAARLVENSSDANVPMQLGIPAIAIGAGGSGTNTHSLAETFDSTDSVRGSARALLLTIALSRR